MAEVNEVNKVNEPGPDPVAAELEAIRERLARVFRERVNAPSESAAAIRASARDVPRLLAVAEAALKHHQPSGRTHITPCAAHQPFAAEDALALAQARQDCGACVISHIEECFSCAEPWPCQEYRDITSALTGSETADVT